MSITSTRLVCQGIYPHLKSLRLTFEKNEIMLSVALPVS